jgi:hypothetical protein
MIKYPFLATTNAAKYAFIKRGIELLRREHNIIGKWFREGLKEVEYQKLRARVQQFFPYHDGTLSQENWDKYRKDRFDVKMKLILEAEGVLKNSLYNSTRFSCNLDDDII